MSRPPGDSIEPRQAGHVAAPGSDLAEGLQALLARIGDEIDFNLAKGSSPTGSACTTACVSRRTRSSTCSQSHGYEAEQRPRAADA